MRSAWWFHRKLFRKMQRKFSNIPSNLLISSGGINFVTQTAIFYQYLPGLFKQISKSFKNILSLKYFFLLNLLHAKKWLIRCFLKISILSYFVTKLILKTLKNPLKNTNKEAKYKTAIPMKYSSKFLNSRNTF